MRDFGAGEVESAEAVLDAIDLRPALFQTTRRGRAPKPFDTATPRATLGRYREQAVVSGALAPVLTALSQKLGHNLAALASAVRVGIGGGYEMAREVGKRDDVVGEALKPAIALRAELAATRVRKARDDRAQARRVAVAASAAASAARAKAVAERAAAKSAA